MKNSTIRHFLRGYIRGENLGTSFLIVFLVYHKLSNYLPNSLWEDFQTSHKMLVDAITMDMLIKQFENNHHPN